MNPMELSIRVVDGIEIYFAKDAEGVEIHPDFGEEGLKRILGIFAERARKKWAGQAAASEREEAERTFRDFAAILNQKATLLPNREALTARLTERGKVELLHWDAMGEPFPQENSAEADWLRRNSR
ncbi:hypothetical protein [Microvirga yunnanensis]|uniref:hypothetical protein n=1 Tax=Microvirga yunnanensis TaxID=2953740 RepID=UPI0021C61380|nr:hypothetical protein [Microvirga sp. HBU65207]